jgi:hypothetical protein
MTATLTAQHPHPHSKINCIKREIAKHTLTLPLTLAWKHNCHTSWNYTPTHFIKNLNYTLENIFIARFEVFTAVTMKNCVFWDVTPCGSCKNRLFGGT